MTDERQKFLKIEDNGDGTCTISAWAGDRFPNPEVHGVIPMDFDEMMDGAVGWFLTNPGNELEEIADKVVVIPNQPPEEG